jgi:hypothetical protein
MRRVCQLLSLLALSGACSDPIPAPAKLAARVDVNSGTCNGSVAGIPEGNTNLFLSASTDLEGLNYAVDGKDGAKVSCTVHEDAANSYTFKIEYEAGSTYLQFSGKSSNGAGTGTSISYITTRENGTLGSSECSVTVLRQAAGGGAIGFSYDCKNVMAPSFPGAPCKAVGTIVVDRCGT